MNLFVQKTYRFNPDFVLDVSRKAFEFMNSASERKFSAGNELAASILKDKPVQRR